MINFGSLGFELQTKDSLRKSVVVLKMWGSNREPIIVKIFFFSFFVLFSIYENKIKDNVKQITLIFFSFHFPFQNIYK